MTGIARRIDRLTAEWWLVLLLALALVAACVATRFTARFDMLLYDVVQRSLQHRPQPSILLVSIDDRSLEEIGPWPWPRSEQARLLTALAQGRPRAVALDILLLDQREEASDQALAQAIASGAPTYLPVQFQIPGRNGAGFDILEPISPFREAVAGLGQANLMPDSDGIVRRTFLEYTAGSVRWPHLITKLSGVAPTRSAETQASADPDAIVARSPAMISFTGPVGTFPNISAASVIRGEVPVEVLAGKYVLVGATATGIGDAYATPVGGDRTLMPGIEIQANLLDSILSKRVILPIEGLWHYLCALAPILAMMLGLRFLRPRWTLWLLAALIGLVLLVSVAQLSFGLWMPLGSALLGLLIIYPLWNWRRLATVSAYFGEELEKLEAEYDPLERKRPDLARLDHVDRQMALLQSAIDRERDQRRFFIDRIAQMPDAVLVTDQTGTVVIANDAALRLWESLGGKAAPTTADALLSNLQSANSKAPLAFQPESYAPLATWQSEAVANDGRTFALRCEPQRAADETVIGAVVRIVDTTEAMLALREREEVMQLLSHDMRSPQVSILTLLESGKSGFIEPNLAKRMRGYAERTLRLADGFVQLSRAQSLRFDPQVIDIVDVAQEAIDALWPQANESKVTVLGDLPDAEVLVLGERSLLNRMFVNLLDNAVRYSKAGQMVRVTVSAEPMGRGGFCKITVADQGQGIAPEQLRQLYQRFQSGSSRIKSAGGVGLGLAFVQATVLRLSGTIECTSTLGEGTCFEIAFPLHEEVD